MTRTGRTAAGAGALVPLLATGLVLALGTLGPTPALAAPHPTSGHPRHAVAPTSAAPAPALRPLPSPLYGVTVDDVADLGGIVASTEALPSMPTTRITFDVHEPASYYAPAVHALHPVSYLMGELLDSSESRKIGVAAYARRVASYLAAFDGLVDVWEIGNEVNGDWTGRYGTVAAKLVRAYDEVAGAGQRSALTLYDNVGCGDGPRELDPLAFSRTYVPASVRDGLTYVLLSYYEDDCGGIRPSAAWWTAYFAQLHALYPHALLGFGEIGMDEPATPATTAGAESLIHDYYALPIALPYYVGGYFWWYYAEDCVPTTRPLWAALRSGFEAESAALGP